MLITRFIINMITHKKYILASSSASRKRILTNCGFVFKQIAPTSDEEEIKKRINMENKPNAIAKRLSFEKAKSISIMKKYHSHYVIGCDTLIYLDKRIFDKAKTLKEAKSKIKKLSGKQHKIVSGLTVCHKGRSLWQCSETTNVKVRELSYFEIDTYLKKTGKRILKSVGCYQLESLGPQIIEEIKGDFFNVLGLPLFKLLKYVSLNK